MRYLPRSDCQIPTLADGYEQHLPEGPGRFVEIGAFDGLAYSNSGYAKIYADHINTIFKRV